MLVGLKTADVRPKSPRRLHSWLPAGVERRDDLGVRVVTWEFVLLPLDVKQAFGDVTLVTMSDTVTDLDIKAALAASILRE